MRLPRSDERQKALEDTGLDLMEYDKRWGAYRIRLQKKDVSAQAALLVSMLKEAYDARLA